MRANGIVMQDDTMMYQFQSTLPRGERLHYLLSVLFTILVSIHAPTRGATAYSIAQILHLRRFNPRSHEGSDHSSDRIFPCLSMFQSTLPRGERLYCLPRRYNDVLVSIHAPTRGSDCMMYILLILLSLHHLFLRM